MKTQSRIALAGSARMRYYVYIGLPARLSGRVEAVSRRFGKRPPSDPHLTLLIPGALAPGRTEGELVAALRRAAAGIVPCRVRYRGVGFFGAKDFIYVTVHRTRPLVACHQACKRAVRGLLVADRPYLFARPHITLAGRFSPEDGARAWAALRRASFDGAFECREIQLWRKGEHQRRWSLVETFPLLGDRR